MQAWLRLIDSAAAHAPQLSGSLDPSGGGGLERPARPLMCVAKARWNGIAGPRLMDYARAPDQARLVDKPLEGDTVMKTTAILLAAASLALAPTSADAKGCLKGAVVGGVAGHYAVHHGVLGAVAGCIYGRRHARQQELQRQQQQGKGADAGKGADVGQTGM
jgi:hypothetical protein